MMSPKSTNLSPTKAHLHRFSSDSKTFKDPRLDFKISIIRTIPANSISTIMDNRKTDIIIRIIILIDPRDMSLGPENIKIKRIRIFQNQQRTTMTPIRRIRHIRGHSINTGSERTALLAGQSSRATFGRAHLMRKTKPNPHLNRTILIFNPYSLRRVCQLKLKIARIRQFTGIIIGTKSQKFQESQSLTLLRSTNCTSRSCQ